jgi:radical SAM-linked protein
MLFEFTKTGRAVYTPHLGLLGVFERAYRRAGLPVSFTEGFNPKPRQEFAQPLSLGIASESEFAMVAVREFVQPEVFCKALSTALPPGIEVTAAVHLTERGENLPSLMSKYWGSDFRIDMTDADLGVEELSSILAGAAGVRDITGQREVLEVRIAHEGGRARGLGKLLKTAFETDPAALGVRITRTATYARGDGPDPAAYFDVYAAAEATQSPRGESGAGVSM